MVISFNFPLVSFFFTILFLLSGLMVPAAFNEDDANVIQEIDVSPCLLLSLSFVICLFAFYFSLCVFVFHVFFCWFGLFFCGVFFVCVFSASVDFKHFDMRVRTFLAYHQSGSVCLSPWAGPSAQICCWFPEKGEHIREQLNLMPHLFSLLFTWKGFLVLFFSWSCLEGLLSCFHFQL